MPPNLLLLQNVVSGVITDNFPSVRSRQQTICLLCNTKLLLSAVVVLQNVGIYFVIEGGVEWRRKKVDEHHHSYHLPTQRVTYYRTTKCSYYKTTTSSTTRLSSLTYVIRIVASKKNRIYRADNAR